LVDLFSRLKKMGREEELSKLSLTSQNLTKLPKEASTEEGTALI